MIRPQMEKGAISIELVWFCLPCGQYNHISKRGRGEGAENQDYRNSSVNGQEMTKLRLSLMERDLWKHTSGIKEQRRTLLGRTFCLLLDSRYLPTPFPLSGGLPPQQNRLQMFLMSLSAMWLILPATFKLMRFLFSVLCPSLGFSWATGRARASPQRGPHVHREEQQRMVLFPKHPSE